VSTCTGSCTNHNNLQNLKRKTVSDQQNKAKKKKKKEPQKYHQKKKKKKVVWVGGEDPAHPLPLAPFVGLQS
jgi:hypothetical protein